MLLGLRHSRKRISSLYNVVKEGMVEQKGRVDEIAFVKKKKGLYERVKKKMNQVNKGQLENIYI